LLLPAVLFFPPASLGFSDLRHKTRKKLNIQYPT